LRFGEIPRSISCPKTDLNGDNERANAIRLPTVPRFGERRLLRFRIRIILLFTEETEWRSLG